MVPRPVEDRPLVAGEVHVRLRGLRGVHAHGLEEAPALLAQGLAYGQGEVLAAVTAALLVHPAQPLVRLAGGIGVYLDGEVLEVQSH